MNQGSSLLDGNIGDIDGDDIEARQRREANEIQILQNIAQKNMQEVNNKLTQLIVKSKGMNAILYGQGEKIDKANDQKDKVFEELEKTELLVKKLKYSAWIQKFSLQGIAAILTFFNIYLILKKVISLFF